MTAPPTAHDLLSMPAHRRAAIAHLARELRPGRSVALSTHVNADGDGCGSEVALVHLLGGMGMDVRIVNPTPWPAMFEFLLGEGEDRVREESARGAAALREVDVLVVLDISDVSRLGQLADTVRSLRIPKLVIDHHIATDEPAGSLVFADTAACATGELVFDLATELGLPITVPAATALYAAVLTDTGGFRFSNTTPRCHAMAACSSSATRSPPWRWTTSWASRGSPCRRARWSATT
jgi:phosphoesterase RecJ-like protein